MLLGFVALTACSHSAKETLGLSKASPDEYDVVRHAPLSMPPQGYFLATPSNEVVTQEVVHDDSVEEVLLGKPTKVKSAGTGSLSASDESFIGKTQSIKKKEDIKEVLAKEEAAKPTKKTKPSKRQ